MSHVNPHLLLSCFKGLARLFPAPPLDRELVPTEEILKAKAKHWNRLSAAVFPIVVTACCTGFCSGLLTLTKEHLASLPPQLLLIRAMPAEFYLWGIFLGVITGSWLSFLLLRVTLGKKRYDEFIMIVSNASPMGGEEGLALHVGKVFTFMFVLLAPLLAAVSFLRTDTTAFTKDAMIRNPFWSIGKVETHSYKDIRGLYAVDGYHGWFQSVARLHHAIRFSDGTLWTTRDGLRQPELESDGKLLDEISRRTKRPIREVKYVEDIPK